MEASRDAAIKQAQSASAEAKRLMESKEGEEKKVRRSEGKGTCQLTVVLFISFYSFFVSVKRNQNGRWVFIWL